MVQTFPLLDLGLQRHTAGGPSPLLHGTAWPSILSTLPLLPGECKGPPSPSPPHFPSEPVLIATCHFLSDLQITQRQLLPREGLIASDLQTPGRVNV